MAEKRARPSGAKAQTFRRNRLETDQAEKFFRPLPSSSFRLRRLTRTYPGRARPNRNSSPAAAGNLAFPPARKETERMQKQSRSRPAKPHFAHPFPGANSMRAKRHSAADYPNSKPARLKKPPIRLKEISRSKYYTQSGRNRKAVGIKRARHAFRCKIHSDAKNFFTPARQAAKPAPRKKTLKKPFLPTQFSADSHHPTRDKRKARHRTDAARRKKFLNPKISLPTARKSFP